MLQEILLINTTERKKMEQMLYELFYITMIFALIGFRIFRD